MEFKQNQITLSSTILDLWNHMIIICQCFLFHQCRERMGLFHWLYAAESIQSLIWHHAMLLIFLNQIFCTLQLHCVILKPSPTAPKYICTAVTYLNGDLHTESSFTCTTTIKVFVCFSFYSHYNVKILHLIWRVDLKTTCFRLSVTVF